MLVDPHARPNLINNGYAPMQWFINQPNTNFNFAIGRTTSNTQIPTQTLTGPIQGTNQGDNPAGKDYIGDINFEQAPGLYVASSYNRDSGELEATGAIEYDPADYFEYFFRANETLPILFDNCFYQNLLHFKSNGLVFMYNGNLGANAQRPGNNNYFLSDNITNPQSNSVVLSNMSYPYNNEHLKTLYYKQNPTNLEGFVEQFIKDFQTTQSNYISGNACIGVKATNGWDTRDFGTNNFSANGSGWVYNQTLGRPASQQFTSSFENDGGIYTQYRYATGVQGFNNRDGVQRADGSTIEIPNVYRINNNGGIVLNCPTMICFSATFDAQASTMIPSNLDPNIRTLLGNDTGRLFEIQLGQNTPLPGGWDFRLTDNTGQLMPNIFVDGGGNRINFRESTNTTGYTYNFIIRYFGPTTDSFRITIEETIITGGGLTMNTTQFQNQGPPMPVIGNAYLANINCFGGRNPLTDNNAMTDYNDYSPLTYLCNFRVYQLSTRTDQAVDIFDFPAEAMTQYFNQHPLYANPK